jgi:hypothetical protein
MKIAVYYRGYLRTISKTFENQKKYLFQNNDIDFFCHTWNSYPEEIQYVKDVINPKRLLIDEMKKFEINPYNTMTITNNNIDISTDHQKDKRLSDGYLQSIPYNVLSMMYSLNQVNNLCKEYSQLNSIKYDAIIVLRPDIYFYDKLQYNELDLKKINISWYENIGDHLNNPHAIIDHIAISNVENIRNYCDCFLYIPSYYYNQSIPFVPETLLGYHVKFNSIETNMIKTRHKVIRIENYNPYDNLDK